MPRACIQLVVWFCFKKSQNPNLQILTKRNGLGITTNLAIRAFISTAAKSCGMNTGTIRMTAAWHAGRALKIFWEEAPLEVYRASITKNSMTP